MRRSNVALVIGALALAGAGTAAALQDEGGGMPSMPKPGPQHESLMKMVGTWETTAEMAMTPGEKIKGKETCRALGDFWVVCDFEMPFMGQEFRGHNVMGYDPEKEKFVSFWFDTMTPSGMTSEGTWDDEAGALVMKAKTKDWTTGEPIVETHTITWKGDDAMTFTMDTPGPEGMEVRSMTIEYERVE